MKQISKVHLYSLMLLLFMFQPVIERHFIFFKYYDEIIVLFSFLTFLRKNKLRLKKYDCEILTLFVLLCFIGIMGNFIASANQPNRAIIQDIFSNGKMILYALSIRKIVLSDKQKKELSDTIAFFVHVLFVILFITSIISQFIDIGMTERVRYGIKSYQFIFNNPAGLNTYCYLYIILHSITIIQNGHIRKNSTLFTILGMVPWILTMRSRAIAFSIIYGALYIYTLYIKKPGSVYKFKWYHLLIIGTVAVILSWDAIDTYFISNDRVARYNLMRTSFKIAKDYFPIGTGFATFGTEASRTFYSSVYQKYGLNYVYGLSNDSTGFITDQYWFGIIGQFGVIGTIIMVVLITKTYKKIWDIAKWEKNSQLACITLFVTSILSSFTAGTFIQASILPSILVFYLLCNKRQENIVVQL